MEPETSSRIFIKGILKNRLDQASISSLENSTLKFIMYFIIFSL